ncbi:3-phosphoshikimate 1-carboxyvinyltransferase [Candidatus Bathyarchaeota archaeon]|nr:MAG: 3-phosphoshikimate 1-carboxyvinyltransferase [Candidatus Bathyarchaeota archaeon]
MRVVLKSSVVDGVVKAPPSKSQTHRFYIAALLSEGLSIVEKPSTCLDTEATLRAIKLMGCKVHRKGSEVKLLGRGAPEPPEDVIHCGGSGTTIRILTAVSALAPGLTVLTGDKSLRRRPMSPLLDALRQLGIRCYSARGGRPPVVVLGGSLKPGLVKIRGDISSQYVSGLLFALAKVDGESIIQLTTSLVSKPYVDMTLNTLRMCGVNIYASEDRRVFEINGSYEFKPFKAVVEGDYSSASVLMVAAAVTGGRVKVEGLKKDSLQPDRRILNVLEEIGCHVRVEDKYVEVNGSMGIYEAFEIDVSDSPDLAPILTVLASSCRGVSKITGVSRLRFKESDRIEALTSQLSKMGLKIRTCEDCIIVKGPSKLKGAIIDPSNDHRIAMACAVAALKAQGETVIRNASCVNKSYPDFYEDLKNLGVDVKAITRSREARLTL